MNTQVIEINRSAAKEALANYVKARRKGVSTREDLLIERGYRAIARGRRVLNLYETLRVAGVDEQRRPKLAIARASATTCWYRHSQFVAPHFRWTQWVNFSNPSPATLHRNFICLPRDVLPRLGDNVELKARVPYIPPHIRPHGRHGPSRRIGMVDLRER